MWTSRFGNQRPGAGGQGRTRARLTFAARQSEDDPSEPRTRRRFSIPGRQRRAPVTLSLARGSRRGAALLTVLWLSAALAAIALSLSITVRGEAERAGAATDGLRCRYLASAAVERAALELVWSASSNPAQRLIPMGAAYIDYAFPSGTARVEIIPETAKLNVNFAPPAEIYRLAVALGIEPGRAREIALAIADWRDPAGGAAFDSYYLSLTPSFRSPHASFQEIEELLAVKGVTPEFFYGTYLPSEEPGGPRLVRRYGLVDCLSVFGSRDRVDINSANPAVLAAVGLNPQAVAVILARRSQGPITPDQFPSVLEMAAAPADRLRVGGNTIFTFRATARLRLAGGGVSDLARTAAAQVKYMPAQYYPPIHILRWYDSAWSN